MAYKTVEELREVLENATEIGEVKDVIEEIKELQSKIEEKDEEMLEMFNDMLVEAYGSIKIGEIEFYADEILKELDPISYKMGYMEYFDETLTDLENLLKEAEEKLEKLSE